MKLEGLKLPFWITSGRPGVSTDELRRAESTLGRRLPDELTKALEIQNGGVSVYSGFRRGDYYVPLPSFLSVEEIVQAERHRAEFGTPEGVIAIASGAHEWLGLDYSSGDEPSVVFQEFEEGDLECVAGSFEALLEGLVEN